MEKSFFIMLPDNKRVNLQGSSLEEVSRVFYKWPKDVQQEMSKGQLYMKDEKGNHIAVEFLNSPEKGKEEELVLPPLPPGLLKFWDKCWRPSLILMTLYLLGFWAVTTLVVFLFSIPWLDRKIRKEYNANKSLEKTSIPMQWLAILIFLTIPSISIIAYLEAPLSLPHGKEVILSERDSKETLPYLRTSCDSISIRVLTIRYRDSLHVLRSAPITGMMRFGFTKVDTLRFTYKISQDTSYSKEFKPLESFCGDTLVSKKYKPYEDRNFSLVRVSKKYYDEYYRLVDTIYYQNQSSTIGDWELEDIFKGTVADWRHTVRVTKYTLTMLDGSKIDTLGTKEDAQSLLEAKCKDRATVEQRLVYAELDACLKNNTVQRIHVREKVWCGDNPVRLSYTRGSVSSYPYRCNESAGWTYSQF